MFKINKPNNYKNTIEALKEACDLDVSFPSNYKGIIDAIMMCKEKNGNINSIIAGVGIELEPEHGDLTESDITISASGLDLFCDDCFVYCPPRPGYGKRSFAAPETVVGDLYVVKLSSESCGLCHRMARYDRNVAEELGYKFIEAKKGEKSGAQFQYLIKKAFPDDDYGFPCYIICQGESEDKLTPIQVHRGAVDKGAFRRRLEGTEAAVTASNRSGSCSKDSVGNYPESVWQESYSVTGSSNSAPSCFWKGKIVNCSDYNRGKQKAYTSGPNGGTWRYYEICKKSDSSPEGDPDKDNECSKDTDCNQNNCKKCKDGKCVNKCSDGKKCDGKGNCVECTKDGDCGNGKICKGNKCVDKPECSQNSDCPKGQICKGGSCVDKPECQINSDCPVGEICDGGKCVDKPCSKNSDCPSGWICKNGICVPDDRECKQDSDCPKGQVCKSNKCVAKEPECRDDTECTGDLVCNGGNCVERPPYNPPQCSNNSDCPGNEVCVNGKCQPPQPIGTAPEDKCYSDGDCGPDQVCDGGLCKDKECDSTSDCGPDEICKNGICKPTECEQSADCPDGKVCIDGECTNPECSEDRDCPSGENCDDGGVCTDRCEDVTCPSGEVCIEGICYKQLCIDSNCDGGWLVDWNCVKTKLGI